MFRYVMSLSMLFVIKFFATKKCTLHIFATFSTTLLTIATVQPTTNPVHTHALIYLPCTVRVTGSDATDCGMA